MQTSTLLENFSNNTTTPTPTTGWNVDIILLPLRLYQIRMVLSWTQGLGGATLDFNGNPFSVFGIIGNSAGDSAGPISRTILSLDSECLDANDNGSAQIDVILHANQGGVLRPQFAQKTPDSDASILLAYTTIQAQDITP